MWARLSMVWNPIMKRIHAPCSTAALMLTLFLSFNLALLAGNTWDGGGGDNNWGTGANWNPDGAPAYGTISFS
ncbi:MAG: hypothetical protein RLY20_1730, partial [Verrucomicrobiota bacterium]